MEISLANIEDATEILRLQKQAYQSEAAIYQDYSIAPLTQTIEEIKGEFDNKLFLKAVSGEEIIGSVRAYSDGCCCFVGRLIVGPKWKGKGVGTKLMKTIETYFTDVQRYELFTGIKSEGNIRLYKRLGYKPFKEQVLNESISLIYMEKIASE
ncbi:MAG TPA: GNAT family N-acetyltransferase [Sedimentisphaerales bacterium]|nr:GNAT family N-acetyltransferase [Sedimentisphaerales bacterium]